MLPLVSPLLGELTHRRSLPVMVGELPEPTAFRTGAALLTHPVPKRNGGGRVRSDPLREGTARELRPFNVLC